MIDPPAASEIRPRRYTWQNTVADAVAWVDRQVQALPIEMIQLGEAAGRVLAHDVISSVNVPNFRRSMMDGFALIAADTSAASKDQPALLTIVGEVLPGVGYSGVVSSGEAVRIMTGAPLPSGADAVLRVESTEVQGSQLQALEAVSPGKHVGGIGEDIAQGVTLLSAGRHLTPQDLGVLSSIGQSELAVVRRPRVRIVITGNELLPAGSTPRDYRISDANGPMLAALIARDGGVALHPGIVADEREAMAAAMHDDADVILVSGGSGAGQEDHAAQLLARDGELALQGISMRPGGPTGMGRIGERLVFLLPGNPVACLCTYDFFAGRAIRQLGGRTVAWPYRKVRRRLVNPLLSLAGRLDYARVTLTDAGVEPIAISGASVLSSTTRATGFVIIPEEIAGYAAGEEVDVWLYGE